jgi:hypothetical protein
MGDYGGVWEPVENFFIAYLRMEEDFHCRDVTHGEPILRLGGHCASTCNCFRFSAAPTTKEPTAARTSDPTVAPTVWITRVPSAFPTEEDTIAPTELMTAYPTFVRFAARLVHRRLCFGEAL